jgi:Cu-Zn family superoxide dismutase
MRVAQARVALDLEDFMMTTRALFVVVSLSVSLMVGCGGGQTATSTVSDPSSTPKETPSGPSARDNAIRVPLSAKSGSKLSGVASFTETPEGVRVVIDVAGLSPGKHATHVHEKGDCSAADAMSAGDHFNPDSHQHGLPSTKSRHTGDLGNIVVGEDGKGHYDVVSPGANLRTSDPHSYVNRALVVHDTLDDGGQPSGNAGGRVGCGEIRR